AASSTGSTPCCSCCRSCTTSPGSCSTEPATEPSSAPVAVRTLAILGSTGSIGTQAIDVVRADPDHHEVVALAAGSSVELLARQARELRPRFVAVTDGSKRTELAEAVPAGTEVLAGPGALAELATAADTVLNAVVGFAGL